MRQRIVRILKHWPFVYRLVSNIYYTVESRHLVELFIGTRARETYWSGRSIAEGYWDGRNHPSKHFLAERIAAFSPVNSILEVGCASGPNLYTLARKFPHAQIVGIDINQEAVEYGNVHFAQAGVHNVKLFVGKADQLAEFQDGAFDVVFTSAVLVYIGPDKIKEVVTGMIRLSRKALVLMELHLFQPSKRDPLGLGICQYGNWVRDYRALLKQLVPESKIEVTKIPYDVWPDEPWKEYGAIIEVTM